jgi:hypothetical protein
MPAYAVSRTDFSELLRVSSGFSTNNRENAKRLVIKEDEVFRQTKKGRRSAPFNLQRKTVGPRLLLGQRLFC